jgi:Holliday junction DNA helicase RuvB
MPEQTPKDPGNPGPKDQPNLRPQTLDDFVGQKDLKKRLSITLDACLQRQDILPHQLLAGPPGLGKTTLAQILAHEINAKITITSGPSLEKPADLAGTLVGLEKGDVLFIDEIHRLSPVVEEFLYPAMEDRKLDILIDTEGGQKSLRIDLQPFTLIGATTKPGRLSAPLRSRFQTVHKLELYQTEELAQIVHDSAKKLDLQISHTACLEIAKRSRGTPRTANNNLLWTRDYVLSLAQTQKISTEQAKKALEEIHIDENGLDATDRKIIKTLCQTFKGGPVGLNSLAISCGEDPETVEDIHEPFLISEGYLKRTPQGRMALEKSFKTQKSPHALL